MQLKIERQKLSSREQWEQFVWFSYAFIDVHHIVYLGGVLVMVGVVPPLRELVWRGEEDMVG